MYYLHVYEFLRFFSLFGFIVGSHCYHWVPWNRNFECMCLSLHMLQWAVPDSETLTKISLCKSFSAILMLRIRRNYMVSCHTGSTGVTLLINTLTCTLFKGLNISVVVSEHGFNFPVHTLSAISALLFALAWCVFIHFFYFLSSWLICFRCGSVYSGSMWFSLRNFSFFFFLFCARAWTQVQVC